MCNGLLLLQVKYAADKRSIMVTTKATAPGGARTEKVGLPFDPDLFDHMVEHGVIIEVFYACLFSLVHAFPNHKLQECIQLPCHIN